MSNKLFNDWLRDTRELQILSFGTDPGELEGASVAEFIRWNMLAAGDELYEALHEVDWKPWTVTEDGIRNREAFVGELVDVLHFVANMLVAAKCSDEELDEAYLAKMQKNRDRMASKSYDGRNKCPNCGRAYDDAGIKCTPGTLTGSAVTAYTCHESDGSVVVAIKKKEWQPVIYGAAPGTTVRVKQNAYEDGELADLHNGRVGELVQNAHGQCFVKYEDDDTVYMHVMGNLETLKH